MPELILFGLGFAIAQAWLAHSLAHTPATLLACCGGYAIALAAFTGWAWAGQSGAGLLFAAALLVNAAILRDSRL